MVIPRGLIKWQNKKERSPASKFLCLELSAGSHGEGVIQVIDAYDSGLDIYKVMNGVLNKVMGCFNLQDVSPYTSFR